MIIDESKVKLTRDSEEFRTSSSRLAQFSKVLGFEQGPLAEGKLAHPIFPHIPTMQSMVEVLRSAVPGFGFHGEHDLHFHAPMVPGQKLFTVSTLQSLRQTGAGPAVVIRSDLKTAEGELVNVQYTTSVFPDGELAGDVGEPAPPKPDLSALRSDEPDGIEIRISDDLAHQYSDVSRDYSPYTMRQDYAEKIGMKAPILHGMCTLGLAAHPVLKRAGNPDGTKLKRFGCRFSHPLYMTGSRTISVRHWLGKGDNGPAVLFEVADDEGNLVIRNGFAEFSI